MKETEKCSDLKCIANLSDILTKQHNIVMQMNIH